jgi:hypothetical protein
MPGPNAWRLPQYYFNAVDEQFNPQPLFLAMAEAIQRPRAVERGFRQEDDWAIEYGGEWLEGRDARAVLGRYRESRGDATLRIPFEGTELTLVLGRQPGGGTLSWSVDGGPERQAPTDAAIDEWGARLVAAEGLADGRHVFEARVADGRPVRLDGVIVDRLVRWPGVGPPSLLLGLGALGVLAAAASSRRSRA